MSAATRKKAARTAPEIETAEALAAKGWQRLTLVFESILSPSGEWEETEILADPEGELWLVSDWQQPDGDGTPHRAARRRIGREAACAMVAKANIPEAFRGDFRECHPPRLRLETAIQETRAFLVLMADSEAGHLHGNYSGATGETIRAGMASLSARLVEELTAAFYTAGDALS